jgi:hypothetical protein
MRGFREEAEAVQTNPFLYKHFLNALIVTQAARFTGLEPCYKGTRVEA